jgi:hypothetical protein
METFDVTSLRGLQREITRIVDFKESATVGCVAVNLRVDPDLDVLKEKMAGLPEALALMASDLSDSVGLSWNMRRDIVVACYPHYGYLISVPVELKRFFRRREFCVQFNLDGLVFYSHHRLEQLTVTYAHIDRQIRGMLLPLMGLSTQHR